MRVSWWLVTSRRGSGNPSAGGGRLGKPSPGLGPHVRSPSRSAGTLRAPPAPPGEQSSALWLPRTPLPPPGVRPVLWSCPESVTACTRAGGAGAAVSARKGTPGPPGREGASAGQGLGTAFAWSCQGKNPPALPVAGGSGSAWLVFVLVHQEGTRTPRGARGCCARLGPRSRTRRACRPPRSGQRKSGG